MHVIIDIMIISRISKDGPKEYSDLKVQLEVDARPPGCDPSPSMSTTVPSAHQGTVSKDSPHQGAKGQGQ